MVVAAVVDSIVVFAVEVEAVVVVFEAPPRLLDVDISSRIGPRNMSW